ncbi:MAG: B12-binding domain-containing protein [Hyphomicrobiaceae bacterium]
MAGSRKEYKRQFARDPEAAMRMADPADRSQRAFAQTLKDVIEQRIIPRLLASHLATEHGSLPFAHVAAAEADQHNQFPAVAANDVERFADALVAGAQASNHNVFDIVTGLQRSGVAPEQILMELYGQAANALGERWLSDTLSFADVTLALGHLQSMTRELAPTLPLNTASGMYGHRVRLLSLVEEQHTYGVQIVSELFRSNAWDVTTGQPDTIEDFERELEERWYDVIGLSVSCCQWLDRLLAQTSRMRQASANPDVSILAGGSVSRHMQDMGLDALGLDAIVLDGSAAVCIARDLVAGQRMRRLAV